MTAVTAGAGDAGRSCPYCRFPLKEGIAAERCDSCGALHHRDCWSDGGGCAVLGCAGGGSAQAAAPAAGPPTVAMASVPAPPMPVAQPQMAGYPPPPPSQRRAPSTTLAVAVLIALLGVGAGVLLASGALERHTTQKAAVSLPASRAPAPAAMSQAERASDQASIVGVLDAYQSAYSSHDLHGLERIFTPAVKRHGLASGGCTVSRGRSAVLSDYSSQFAAGSGAYRLLGLSPGEVRIDDRRHAHIHANYEISPGGSGYVNFTFLQANGGWYIDQVYATCA